MQKGNDGANDSNVKTDNDKEDNKDEAILEDQDYVSWKNSKKNISNLMITLYFSYISKKFEKDALFVIYKMFLFLMV